MKKITIVLVLAFLSFGSFSQSKYINGDGTITNAYKRELFVETFKIDNNKFINFDLEDRYLVITTMFDCENEKYSPQEMQERALHYSFYQLLDQISALQKVGYKSFIDMDFAGIIFKTNTICMYNTRRYHFKFNIYELNSFPQYMDLKELMEYVINKNRNKNIIHVKNN